MNTRTKDAMAEDALAKDAVGSDLDVGRGVP